MFCVRCGQVVDTTGLCPSCGLQHSPPTHQPPPSYPAMPHGSVPPPGGAGMPYPPATPAQWDYAAQPYPAYPGGYPPGHPTTNTRARNSLILAIVGIFICGLVLEPGAILERVKAKRELRERPWEEGDGMATAGIIIGSIWVGLFSLLILVLVLTGA